MFNRLEVEQQLEVDEIQGDVLVGLQKDRQVFIAFEIRDVQAFRQFLLLLAPRITTMRLVLEREFILAAQKAAGTAEVFTFIGTAIGFTAAGLEKLGVGGRQGIHDGAFAAGLAARSTGLNDPEAGEGAAGEWLVGGPNQPLHGLLTVTGPRRRPASTADVVEDQAKFLIDLAGSSIAVLHQETGETRPDARGHEHFGFQDGISQPGLRGRIDNAFPSHSFLSPGLNPDDPGQGLPGQDLLWPGEFVFGYPGQSDADVADPGPVKEGGAPWMRNGSFLVWRRLRQRVPEFDAFLTQEARELDMDAELLGARMVGRWKSGAPLVTAPLQDDATLAADPMLNNAFAFAVDGQARRCPFAAHIRKSYPRDDITPAADPDTPDAAQRRASATATQAHRIIRAGIPFGPPLSDDEQDQGRTIENRGLMFVCYQTSIANQFEFILKNWLNNDAFPPASDGAAGEDPILGQATGTGRVRHFAGGRPAYPTGPGGPSLTLRQDFIVPTGGGYFFVPSLTALTAVLAQAEDTTAPLHAGEWAPLMKMPNVAVHSHLLPDGNVLFWGRRDHPDGTMDEHECTPQIWDRSVPSGSGTPPVFRATPQPLLPDGSKVNLFCSDHAFLPDGRLFVAGGHLFDSFGVDQASLFDWRTGLWTAKPPMNHGRWYPTVTNLVDGTALVTSGSYGVGKDILNNDVPQIFDGDGWRDLAPSLVSLFPRLVALPDGRVFLAGSDPDGAFLSTTGAGAWSPAPSRAHADRQYAPAVMYAPGKILFIGGGNDSVTKEPTAAVERIDFAEAEIQWRPAASMHFPRRQHNATLLPDGTVLVTGGSRGGGGVDDGFNDLSPGAPVHEAELWDPATDSWTVLAAEDNERCYHSTALLLPDGTVLCAGGGEYKPGNVTLPDAHVHRDGQVFSPPYLFRGDRPALRGAPDSAAYGETFEIILDKGPAVARLTALRPGSVTHSMDVNQRLVELAFKTRGSIITVTAPPDRETCPPGHYLMFALSESGVPSVALTIRIGDVRQQPVAAPVVQTSILAKATPITAAQKGTRVVVGLTSRCPYGLAACWGGAYHSLKKLAGVASVERVADAETSTAELFLDRQMLPDLSGWRDTFTRSANGSYDVRGFEITIDGMLEEKGHRLVLDDGTVVALEPLGTTSKVQWDWDRQAAAASLPEEAAALGDFVGLASGADRRARVTGPLRQDATGQTLAVRSVEPL